VPAMAFIYVFLGLSVLIMNVTKIPGAFALIFKSAFGWQAVAGGAAGFVLKQIMDSMQKGIARGIFSNEAGLGSAPIAASAVQTQEPVEQGLVNMTGTVIDTLIICTMTGLSIVIAGGDVWNSGLNGAALTAAAFSKVLGGDGSSVQFLLMLCLIFFAFTTILGWDYYSERCLEYLTKGNMGVVKVYRWLYILAVAIGPYMTISAVWTIADITNGLMAIPNCISLIVLSGVVAKETKDYFDRHPTLK
ncbi:MAG: alanine:cation symporter family protein, partial [Spirochaetales bacterium]|nr:alanine:cation symporter family protein [Spirochaetales bacterium]